MCLSTPAPARTPDLLQQELCTAIPTHAWEAARAGSAQAQFMLGHAFLGDSCTQTDSTVTDAVNWLSKASDQGHMGATLYLAVMYDDGERIAADNNMAVQYYRRAAQAQHIDAQHHLGLILTKKDDVVLKQEGLFWLGSAASQGDDLSAAVLGVIYAQGLNGIEQDYCMALDWFEAGLLMETKIPLMDYIQNIPSSKINMCQE
jgi:TPR repeat protein